MDECEGRATKLEKHVKNTLRAAREIYHDLSPSDETFSALTETFDRECLVDLIMAICFYCGVVREIESLRIDVEPDYEKYLRMFPLPEQPSQR